MHTEPTELELEMLEQIERHMEEATWQADWNHSFGISKVDARKKSDDDEWARILRRLLEDYRYYVRHVHYDYELLRHERYCGGPKECLYCIREAERKAFRAELDATSEGDACENCQHSGDACSSKAV